MILFENALIKLDYNPATDILDVAYPDLHGHLIPEIKNSIDLIVENITNYDVKKLLLDSSRTVVTVPAEDSRKITTYFVAGLSKTRILKVARLQVPSSNVEVIAQNNLDHVKKVGLMNFQVETFNSKSEAINWLKT